MNRNLLSIPLALIDVPTRLRDLDPDWAALIAASFQERGQDTPIWVTLGDAQHGRHRLIAGMHRLEAARLCGWDKIQALVFDGSELEAELLEIDENLLRRELSELDRAAFLSARKRVWLALHPETAPGKHGRQGKKDKVGDLASLGIGARFSEDAAEKLGLSARTVDRIIKRHGDIATDVRKRLAPTPFADRGVVLDALARLSAVDQRRVVDELLRETQPAGNVREAQLRLGLICPRGQNEAEVQFAALLAAWKKAGAPARKQFLAHLRTSGAMAPTGDDA